MIREAIRFLRQSRLISLSAIMVLAVGMAASAAGIAVLMVFSQPASPGVRPGTYLTIAEETNGGGLRPVSWRALERLRDQFASDGFGVAAYADAASVPLVSGGQQNYVRVAAVSSDFFAQFVGAFSAGGNTMQKAASCANQNGVVLSAALSRRLFGMPAQAIGRTLQMQGADFQVVGVAADSFLGLFGAEVEAWIPAQCVGRVYLNLGQAAGFTGEDLWKSYPAFYAVMAAHKGLRPREFFQKTYRTLQEAHGNRTALNVYSGLTIDPERDRRMRNWASLGVFLSVCFTLASCLNFAGLLMARAPRQWDEIRLRRALGAATSRLLFDLSAGPLLLVCLAFVSACTLLLMGMGPVQTLLQIPHAVFQLSAGKAVQAIAWEFLIAVTLSAILVLLPMMRLLGGDGAPRLGYTATGTKKSALLLQGVVAAQVGFCSMVLAVSAMAFHTADQLMHRKLGFEVQDRSVFAVSELDNAQFALSYKNNGPFPLITAASQASFKLSAMPGVKKVALALHAPLDIPEMSLNLRRLEDSPQASRSVTYNAVSQNYFECLGMPLLSGQGFSSGSLVGAPAEAVVNHSLAKLFSSDRNILGKVLKATIPTTGVAADLRVTGVVEDALTTDPKESPRPTIFLPFRGTALAGVLPWYVIVHSDQPMRAQEKLLNAEVAKQLPGMGTVYSYRLKERMEKRMRSEYQQELFAIAGSTLMALIALTGVYSSLVYFAGTKRREFAIRISFGATPSKIAGVILRRALQNGAAAIALTLLCWPLLRRLVASTLVEAAWSPWLASGAMLFTCAAVLTVSLIPAIATHRIPIALALHDQ